MNIKFPVSWLREYLKTDVATKTIANCLTASGPSVEQMEKIGEDYTFNIEVTSNRPDTASVFGIAREAHAILKSNGQKSQLILPYGLNMNLDPDTSKQFTLDIQVTDSRLCPRFTAVVLGVTIGQSPARVINRLKMSGVRPVNNIVDITNYIMLETGQPMHAFDFDKITGAKMRLRASKEGEKLTTLDGVKRSLPGGAIVIEDAKRLVDLCGIMGGDNSQITTRTKRAIFFVQAYNPNAIRRTTQALSFRTDAASLFEKGVDIENILPVLSQAVYLAKKNAGAKIISELVDIYPRKQTSPTISIKLNKLNKYLGLDIPKQKAADILDNLGFKTTTTSDSIVAQAPSWRANDIESDVDLTEEIARVYGYHKLPSALPQGALPNRRDSILKNVIELKKALKNIGLTEVITYSIISKSMLNTTGVAKQDAVELANPLTEEWQFMRPTLVPSLLEVIGKNQYIRSTVKIFEIARTYVRDKNNLPVQDLKIAFALQNSSFLEIKGVIENLFEILRRKVTFTKLSNESVFFEKSQSAILKIGDQLIGHLGMTTKEAADSFGITSNVAIAELNLTLVYSFPQTAQNFRPIPKFPPVIEDISAIYSIFTTIANITTEVNKASDLVKKIEVIDIFQDPKLGEDKKSVTLSLTYQKLSSTPTQEEVNQERAKITKALESNLRAKIRK